MGVKVRKPKGHKSWCVVIDHQGRRKTKAIGSREAAERVRKEIETRLALNGIATFDTEPSSSPIVQDYAVQWLTHAADAIKPSTLGFYEQYLRLYVLPCFGSSRLNEIQRDHIKRFLVDLRGRGLAKNTIRLAVAALRAMLSAAVEDQHLQTNPAQRIGRFVKSEKAPREATSLQRDEAECLVHTAAATLPLRDYALILTGLRAGLREGELAALRWGDMQFGFGEHDRNRFLVVQRNYDRRWSHKMLTTKSKKSRRVDMSRELRRNVIYLRKCQVREWRVGRRHTARGNERFFVAIRETIGNGE